MVADLPFLTYGINWIVEQIDPRCSFDDAGNNKPPDEDEKLKKMLAK
jgi:hypothetical protein